MEPLTVADPPAVREFRVLARLGAGGMGRVYLATSPAGRFIAIKVIHPQFAHDAEFIRRFRGEADAAQRVSGLYTAPVVAAGVDDSPPWLATAFVPGPSLHEVVARRGPLPPAALWRLAAGLAEALLAIHSAGLVHRDLKPGNVLMASDGPRVIDFGIARAAAAGTRMTATGAIIGTPSFMSPEQVEGIEVGPASDVFSFGSVLAFAATGASPFAGGPGASTPSIMFSVVHGEPALTGVASDLREVVTACLTKDPANRPGLREVAARSTAAVEYLGLSPTAFWPDGLAGIIDAQVAALSEELRAIQVPVGQLPRSAPPPVMNQPGGPGTGGYPGGPGGATRPPTYPGQQAYPGQLGYPGQAHPGGQFPGTPLPASPPVTPHPVTALPGWRAAPTHPAGRGTSSRRAVLIGACVAGVAAIGGGTAWALSAKGSSGSSGHASTGPGSLAWRFAATQQPNSPLVAGGLVYFGTGNQGADHAPLYAVSVKSGQQAWTQSPNMVSVAPTVVGGILCVVDTTGILYAANAVTGKQDWSVSTRYQVNAGEQTWDATATRVALAWGDGSVRLFDAATGGKIWEATSSTAAWQYVAFSGNDALYAFDPQSGSLSALSMSSGRPLWSVQVYPETSASNTGLFRGDGNLYTGTQDGTVYCVDTTSRQVRWKYAVPGGSFPASGLVIADGLAYFTDSNGVLRAITTATGQQAWSYQVGSTASPAPDVALAGGYLYVPTENALQQLHAASGTTGWSFAPDSGTTLSAQFVTSTAVGGGLVFAGGNDSAMYAIRA